MNYFGHATDRMAVLLALMVIVNYVDSKKDTLFGKFRHLVYIIVNILIAVGFVNLVIFLLTGYTHDLYGLVIKDSITSLNSFNHFMIVVYAIFGIIIIFTYIVRSLLTFYIFILIRDGKSTKSIVMDHKSVNIDKCVIRLTLIALSIGILHLLAILLITIGSLII